MTEEIESGACTEEPELISEAQRDRIVAIMEEMQEDPAFLLTWQVLSLSPSVTCDCTRCKYVKLQLAARLIGIMTPSDSRVDEIVAAMDEEGTEAIRPKSIDTDVAAGRELFFKLLDEGNDIISVLRIICAMITGVMYALASVKADGEAEAENDEA